MLFKTKNNHKKALNVKIYENLKLNFKFLYEKFKTFCNIFYDFSYPEPEPGLKTWAPAQAKSGCSTSSGSGSATLM
jgi:hypothetical protein